MNQSIFSIVIIILTLSRAAAVDSVVVFNEINYHPGPGDTADEWVELHNQMAIDIDLSAWHIEDGINFTFSEGTIIPAGGYCWCFSGAGDAEHQCRDGGEWAGIVLHLFDLAVERQWTEAEPMIYAVAGTGHGGESRDWRVG